MRRNPNVWFMPVLVAVAASLLLVACEEESTPEPQPTETAALATDVPAETASEPTVTPGASAIREVDFASVDEVRDFITENGGEVDSTAILYADLTGDGAEEAIVPISSGGTLGNLAIFVFSYDSYGAAVLLQIDPEGSGGIAADLQEGQLFTDEAVLGPNDPECCPSTVHRTFYRWDGSALVVDGEEDIPADPGNR